MPMLGSLGEHSCSILMGEFLKEFPFLPTVTLLEADSWREVGAYAAKAGIRGVEVLLRTAHAERGVALLKEAYPCLTVGLGTILSQQDFERAERCGADFAVSPGVLPEILQMAKASTLGYLPGVMTPSEIMKVSAEGFFNAKLFPAGYLHPSFITAIEGPFPLMNYCVSGGVSEDNWALFVKCPSVRTISGSWILPQKPLEGHLAQGFIDRLKEKHLRFAGIRKALT